MVGTKLLKHPNFNSKYYHYTTGREIIAKIKLKTHRHPGETYEDLESSVVIVIFYWLNSIIIVQRFTMAAEFDQ